MGRRSDDEYEYEDDEYEEEDWDDDEDWDDGHPAEGPKGLGRGVAFGVLAMAPLFALYELGAGSRRSAAELLVMRPLAPLGDALDTARIVLVALAVFASFVWCSRRDWALGPQLLRVPFEGLLGALLLGPAIALLMQVVDAAPLQAPDQGSSVLPGPGRAAFVAGAAAWEEIVFRVGAYSLLWLLTMRALDWLGAGERVTRLSAELVGLVGSALLFAAFHLDVMLRWLGPGGEPFDAAVFSWRALAGLLLGVLFRLRGPGVAAWTHALFNVALLLGAGPQVFL